ncbi:MAG: hypothetical protein QME64_12430, partial [bacterium]|nr:hypothetical protein [bacterium]
TTQTANSPYFEWYSSATTPLTNITFTLQLQSKYSTSLSYQTTSNFAVPIGGYIVETVSYGWINATTSGTKVILADDASTTVNLGFNFKFYGNTYNSVLISSNGYLSFGTSGRAYSNTTIPNPAEPNNAIYGFWDDLDPSKSSTGIYYLTSGIAPNRQFTVAWVDVPPYSTSPVGQGTFEVTLYETSGDIVCQYQDVNFAVPLVDYGKSATVGIENADGKMGLQYSYNTALLSNGLTLRFALSKTGSRNYVNHHGSFPVSSDTTQWYYEKYGDGTAAGTLSWSSSFAGRTGVVKIRQNPGEKSKLTQVFTVSSAGWYTAQAKVATDIVDVSKQQKVYLYLQELDQATTIIASANQVLQPGSGGFGGTSTWRDLNISFYTQNTLLAVQVVSINNSRSQVTSGFYADEIWVYAGVASATTTVTIANAGFDAGTTGWLVQIYGDGTGAGSWSGWSGLLLGTQSGGEKAKVSQLFSFTGSGIDAIASVKVLSGATTLNNSQKVYLYIYSCDSGYTKIIESSNAILQPGKWTPGVWRDLKF